MLPPPPSISVSFFGDSPYQPLNLDSGLRDSDGDSWDYFERQAQGIGVALSSPENEPSAQDNTTVSKTVDQGSGVQNDSVGLSGNEGTGVVTRRVSVLREGDLERLGGKY